LEDKMNNLSKKVVLIGAGMVGMSFAYALMISGSCDELDILDLDRKRAEGEAMDLNHCLAFSGRNMKIRAVDYDSCQDATIAVICAGVPQKQGEDRISLLKKNRDILDSILEPLMASGFSGILLVATNPVDLMTQYAYEKTKFPPSRVIGSGTTLDTARLRFLIGSRMDIDSRNVHAYVFGEHGDSEFVPWSQAYISTRSLLSIVEEEDNPITKRDLEFLEEEVKSAAYRIIEAKRATYYGIGMALLRIVKAILGNEGAVLTPSVLLEGHYGQSSVYSGVPAIVGGEGIRRILTLNLTRAELAAFADSCDFLREQSRSL
jgi:L-lactate dehydrogenase